MASDPCRLRRDVGALGLLFAMRFHLPKDRTDEHIREAHEEADTADEGAPVS